MAQAMHINNVALPTSMDKRTYSVNFKGLIAHLLDILFVDNSAQSSYYAEELPVHLQRDIGMYR
ncbi:hypothetical protein BOO29_14470 [Vibrio navarrensis]|uniref:hypothetical protein n=1 Tax=Vibrio navarrensis TaxID=29495 RepID=UPI001869802F|nr:hypothetical protein [Vibrio navarrensis]MBE4586138.1 hypothetical protein [Vibrio navarrensis]